MCVFCKITFTKSLSTKSCIYCKVKQVKWGNRMLTKQRSSYWLRNIFWNANISNSVCSMIKKAYNAYYAKGTSLGWWTTYLTASAWGVQHLQLLLFFSGPPTFLCNLFEYSACCRGEACWAGIDFHTGTACVIWSCDSKPTWSEALGQRAARRFQPDCWNCQREGLHAVHLHASL